MSGNKECQRGTLTARYVQCTVQYTVQCTVHCTMQCLIKYMHVGYPCTHWVVTSQPVKTKFALVNVI